MEESHAENWASAPEESLLCIHYFLLGNFNFGEIVSQVFRSENFVLVAFGVSDGVKWRDLEFIWRLQRMTQHRENPLSFVLQTHVQHEETHTDQEHSKNFTFFRHDESNQSIAQHKNQETHHSAHPQLQNFLNGLVETFGQVIAESKIVSQNGFFHDRQECRTQKLLSQNNVLNRFLQFCVFFSLFFRQTGARTPA